VHDSTAPLVELIDVTRSFPGVLALDHVSLALHQGEVHALVGENGAGKSTLINIISGLFPPDSGTLRFAGRQVAWSSPIEARRHGIVSVHQEAELFGTLSVAENMALEQGLPTGTCGWVYWRRLIDDAQRAVRLMGEPIDVRQNAERLSVAQRHMAQIAAAVQQQARVLVLDEPTSALTAAETDWLFEQIARLKRAGVAILYISHRQEEIFRLADRITVLRDGRRVWSGPCKSIDPASLIRHMVGRESQMSAEARRSSDGQNPVRLRLDGLSAADGRFSDISLEARGGEILGIYGLVGSGRSELARTVFGLERSSGGTIHVDGRPAAIASPAEAMACGIAYLPEDRLRQGIFRALSVRANIVISTLDQLGRGPLTSARRERVAADNQVAALSIRCRDTRQPAVQLSGGNQQKVVLARWLLANPSVLILDEPTRGVDVSAKAEIHRLIDNLAQRGAAVILISSDLTEAIENTDDIVVFRHGRVVGRQRSLAATNESIASLALGSEPTAKAAKPRRLRGNQPQRWHSEIARLSAATILFVTLALTNDSFLTPDNLWGLSSNVAVWTILSLGAAVTIMAGAIDISLGSLLGLSSAVAGLVLKLDFAPTVTIPAAIVAALTVGAAGGLLNAALSLAGRVHPIVVTLGTMTIFRGVLIWLTGGETITDLPVNFGSWSTARVLGINGSMAVGLLAAVCAGLWLSRFRTGRYLMAIGASRSAAALVGISHARTWLAAFGVGGFLAALAGIVELSQTGAVQSGVGAGYELTAIAAAVIGGVSISGGRGSAVGVCTGALLLSLIANALVLWEISRYHYSLVAGGLLLAAVLVDRAWRRSSP
jgi:rhamnose transport system ATP-binding protein